MQKAGLIAARRLWEKRMEEMEGKEKDLKVVGEGGIVKRMGIARETPQRDISSAQNLSSPQMCMQT